MDIVPANCAYLLTSYELRRTGGGGGRRRRAILEENEKKMNGRGLAQAFTFNYSVSGIYSQ